LLTWGLLPPYSVNILISGAENVHAVGCSHVFELRLIWDICLILSGSIKDKVKDGADIRPDNILINNGIASLRFTEWKIAEDGGMMWVDPNIISKQRLINRA
jgi:hypothetical protein